MEDDAVRPGRIESVLGAAFCSVAAMQLTSVVLSTPCQESIQWIAASTGAAAMIGHLALKAARRRKTA